MTAPRPSFREFTPKSYSFGRFVLDLERSRLTQDGVDVKLRPKSFELLCYLAQHHGRVVTKEELIKEVWTDAFVTDDSLVQCVRDIRRALEDDSQEYVKTVPRRGYVFEVHGKSNGSRTSDIVGAAETDGTIPAATEQSVFLETATSSAESQAVAPVHVVRPLWPWIGIGLMSIFAIAGLLAWYPRSKSKVPSLSAVPFTTYRGLERNPALSPDGNLVAFTWNGETQGNFDIYIQAIDSTNPRRVTTDPAEDTSPSWSPNGQWIAFLRRLDSDRNQLILIPSVGGPEHVLAETRNRIVGGFSASSVRQNLAWTPDGQWIAVPDREGDTSPAGLFLVSFSTGSKRPLTRAPAGYFDENPAFSPNGLTVAFARLRSTTVSDLYQQPLSKDMFPKGEVQRLTTDGRASHPAWTPDGRLMYVSDARNGPLGLLIPSTPPSFEPLPLNDQVNEFTLGRHLIYVNDRGGNRTNIWRAEVPLPHAPPAVPRRFIASTYGDTNPSYSPNGKEIVFRSNRSGSSAIWIAGADGSNPVQLTSLPGPFFPTWSPKGQRILFHARIDGQPDLFSIAVTGGQPNRLTSDASEDVLASYSRNGEWIYFTSNRSGHSEIWKMPAGGGEATRLTFSSGKDALIPIESWDEKTVYYAQGGSELAIWKIPAEGGAAEPVTDGLANDAAFAVAKEGIYYKTSSERPPGQVIQFLSFSTGQIRPVVVTDEEIGMGLSLSPDERFLIFALREQPGSDLNLIKDFVAP